METMVNTQMLFSGACLRLPLLLGGCFSSQQAYYPISSPQSSFLAGLLPTTAAPTTMPKGVRTSIAPSLMVLTYHLMII